MPQQETYADQSPNIHAKGDVSISYEGFSKAQEDILTKVIERLLKDLDNQEKELSTKENALAQLRDELNKWIKRYEALNRQIDQLPADSPKAIEARTKLKEGDLDGAEESFTMRGVTITGGSF